VSLRKKNPLYGELDLTFFFLSVLNQKILTLFSQDTNDGLKKTFFRPASIILRLPLNSKILVDLFLNDLFCNSTFKK